MLKITGSVAKVDRQLQTEKRAFRGLYGLLILSALLNCMYYWQGQFSPASPAWWLNGGLGCLVPVIIYVLSSVAIGLQIEEPVPVAPTAARISKLRKILDLMESEPTKTAAAKKVKCSNSYFSELLEEAERFQSFNLL